MRLSIPSSWKAVSLEEAVRPEAPIVYGVVQPGKFAPNGVPVIAIRDLPFPSMDRTHKSSVQIEERYARSRVRSGDILISVKGTTGRVGLVPAGFRGNISRDVARIRLRDDQSPEFWFQMLQAFGSQQVLQEAAVGSTRQELSMWTLRGVRFAVPPLREQIEIAKVLTDVDVLIGSTEHLLMKKRCVKQGMMQELLSGRTRLVGGAGVWESVTLGTTGVVSAGGVDKKVHPGEARVRLLNYMDVYTNEFLDSSMLWQEVSAPSAKISKCTVRAGDVFFTPTSETPDDIARSAVSLSDIRGAVYSYHLVRWRPDATWDSTYLAFAFNTPSFREQLSTLASGSGTRYVVSISGFRGLAIPRPSLAEQRAIGEALKAASDEIAALERRLEAARRIKQGMMQELLTGRTRLVPVEAWA